MNNTKPQAKESTESKIIKIVLALGLICAALFYVQDNLGIIDKQHAIFNIVALVLLTLFVIYMIRKVVHH